MELSDFKGTCTFGEAIEAMKDGKRVTREGWNGKNMFLWLIEAAEVKREWMREPGLIAACGDKESLRCGPSVRIKDADGTVITGWLASQTDMFAEDWFILED